MEPNIALLLLSKNRRYARAMLCGNKRSCYKETLYLLAMPFQWRSSPYSLNTLPSSASGHVLRICSALAIASGPMRISRGASLEKLKPLSASST